MAAMVTSRMLQTAPIVRSDVLDGIRARVRRLAAEGETHLADWGVCLYRYRERTELARLTARGVGFCLVLQGAKRVALGPQALCVDAGEMLVVAREVDLQTVVDPDRDRPYLAVALWFDPERVARALLRFAELGSEHTPAGGPAGTSAAFTMEPTAGIASAVERLLETIEDPIDRLTIAPLVLDELMFRLLRTDAAAAARAGLGPTRDAARILDVMQYIRANHARKLTVPLLAKRVAMSPSHFAHRFSSVARMSPMKYVREVRLDRAKALLGEKGARPTEVATEVGFGSAPQFAREFKRRYGASPSQYRGRAGLDGASGTGARSRSL
jgi:AraC-like DNA-binding protein